MYGGGLGIDILTNDFPEAIGDARPADFHGERTSLPVDSRCYSCNGLFELEQSVSFIVVGIQGTLVSFLAAAHQKQEDCQDGEFNETPENDTDPEQTA